MMRMQATVWSRLARWTMPLAVLGAALALVLAGVVALGRFTLQHIRGWDRYQTPFADIVCPPPPAHSSADFLAEVQYLSNLPERLNVLDEHLGSHLAEAFARHPWVEQVLRVEIATPRRVQVKLTYRMPVLAVPLVEQIRAVD